MFLCYGAVGVFAREVMSWVPPYAIEECKAALQSDFGGVSPGDALTRIGLQFWVPTATGGVVKTTDYGLIPDSDVSWFRDWGHARGVEVLLCVFNAEGGTWDWGLAVSAFGSNTSTFVSNLVLTVESFGLDGVDVDLEGQVAPTLADRSAFKLFLELLSTELKARGKVLTVDSFHSPIFNAPNMSWWEDWAGIVDHVHTMGYDDLYEGSTQTLWSLDEQLFRYSWQQAYGVEEAGLRPEQVAMGLPGWTATWGFGGRGPDVLSHIHECIYDCAVPASVCIWDLQLTGTSGATNWRSAVVWETLAQLAAYESIPTDRDGDRMADAWEVKYLGGTNEVHGAAWDDRDGDGALNLDEYIAGTDPTNDVSVFSLHLATTGGGSMVVGFPVQPVAPLDVSYGDVERTYHLEEASNLFLAAWNPVHGSTNLPSLVGVHSYTSATPTVVTRYRGRATLVQTIHSAP